VYIHPSVAVVCNFYIMCRLFERWQKIAVSSGSSSASSTHNSYRQAFTQLPLIENTQRSETTSSNTQQQHSPNQQSTNLSLGGNPRATLGSCVSIPALLCSYVHKLHMVKKCQDTKRYDMSELSKPKVHNRFSHPNSVIYGSKQHYTHNTQHIQQTQNTRLLNKDTSTTR
jgi:hypothetical protein